MSESISSLACRLRLVAQAFAEPEGGATAAEAARDKEISMLFGTAANQLDQLGAFALTLAHLMEQTVTGEEVTIEWKHLRGEGWIDRFGALENETALPKKTRRLVGRAMARMKELSVRVAGLLAMAGADADD